MILSATQLRVLLDMGLLCALRNINETTAPFLWTDDFLVVSDVAGGFCGGAHLFGDISYRTFDLSTGDSVDLWSWIGDTEGEQLVRN